MAVVYIVNTVGEEINIELSSSRFLFLSVSNFHKSNIEKEPEERERKQITQIYLILSLISQSSSMSIFSYTLLMKNLDSEIPFSPRPHLVPKKRFKFTSACLWYSGRALRSPIKIKKKAQCHTAKLKWQSSSLPRFTLHFSSISL